MEMGSYLKVKDDKGVVTLCTGHSMIIVLNYQHLIINHEMDSVSWQFEDITELEVSYSIMCCLEKELMTLQEKWPNIEFCSPETDQINKQMKAGIDEI